MNAFGNLITVREPNPLAPSDGSRDHWTYYSYDLLNHMTQASLWRDGVAQGRSFNYGYGADLLSATNPENGTVSYTYNANHTPATKTDAKGQRIAYDYDFFKRVVKIHKGTMQSGAFAEDAHALVTFSYDANPYDASYGGNLAGRLAAARYHGNNGVDPQPSDVYTEMYNYDGPGQALGKRFQIRRAIAVRYGWMWASANLDIGYSYDAEGRLAGGQYPQVAYGGPGPAAAGPSFAYSYDSRSRLAGMTGTGCGVWCGVKGAGSTRPTR